MQLTVAVEVVQHQANRRRWKLLGHLTVFQLQIQVGESSVPFVRSILFANHVKWVLCHHGMSCPQVADGGDRLQIWRVAANVLNKRWHTADGVVLQLEGWGIVNPPPIVKLLFCYETGMRASDQDAFFGCSLNSFSTSSSQFQVCDFVIHF
jgi:hypothetical protein